MQLVWFISISSSCLLAFKATFNDFPLEFSDISSMLEVEGGANDPESLLPPGTNKTCDRKNKWSMLSKFIFKKQKKSKLILIPKIKFAFIF